MKFATAILTLAGLTLPATLVQGTLPMPGGRYSVDQDAVFNKLYKKVASGFSPTSYVDQDAELKRLYQEVSNGFSPTNLVDQNAELEQLYDGVSNGFSPKTKAGQSSDRINPFDPIDDPQNFALFQSAQGSLDGMSDVGDMDDPEAYTGSFGQGNLEPLSLPLHPARMQSNPSSSYLFNENDQTRYQLESALSAAY
ncbi:hypothetical protein H4R34_001775 [Dimargaris verticillata]|uniref:Uncharacterized protein n=1 Tax=Dimargaris verticillata TaxID=2761393 RepID=A0A9W8B4X5_9FUNG|nr:hypothetical protein H4R34_001775 [Dimargaris verticillata]